MSKLVLLWKVVSLIVAFLESLRPQPRKPTADEQVAHQRELYRRNHPK